ncbi:MAG: Smr/MutS family protein [Flavobacteriales bacterium]|nr:Smr/MutS family protein [Bacteroidota bacterium]MCB9239882.1 Smr/MutS family protein [Flavobacteriales bacterium]
MKCYPEDIERILGVDQIRAALHKQCGGDLGKSWVDKMAPSSNRRQIQKWLDQVVEYTGVIGASSQPSLQTESILAITEKLRIANNVLNDDEIMLTRSAIRLASELIEYFASRQEIYPELNELVAVELPPSSVLATIDDVYDEDGRWKRTASKKLADILSEMDGIERKVFLSLSRTYEKGLSSGWVAETGLTVKEGRLVIPVIAEHKRKIQGVVHDESGGGKILYIEPIEVLESTNRLKELEMERDREMHRIRAKISSLIAPYAHDLQTMDHRMGVLDFIRAKARLALELEAHQPTIHSSDHIEFQNMRHPILDMHHRKVGKDVIPMNIALSESERLMIVSGPNAGGKSVSIKTLALNQYLLQCGMLIPCAPDSKTRIFKKILVDIGDSQSIENDLSSYSGHLTAMKHFIQHADRNTLLVIDEIGSGTDPNFGGAMAESILLAIHDKKPLGMVTTHFGAIKKLADETEGMMNGSMAFDTDKLKPLYRLQAGIPGSSFALEVARNIGLPDAIIKRARKRSNTVEQRTDELLARLESERGNVREIREKLEKEQRHLETLRGEYQSLKEELADKKRSLIDDAREKALQILKEGNAAVERTIREIQESKGDKGKIRQSRKKMKDVVVDHRKSLGLMDKTSNVKPEKKEDTPLKVGDQVFIPNSSSVGEIIELRGQKAVVVAGIIKSTYPLDQLKVSKRKPVKPTVKINVDMINRRADFAMEKDVRGLRGPEALKEIDKWIDQAVIVGSKQLRLIHGKGDGILKKLIRDYYQNSPYVRKISYESFEFGGDGVSIIELA